MTHTDLFNAFCNEQLNPAQKQAVFHSSGPLLIIAGAGSGKTRVITARIAHLILENICQPHELVALTFTNKAAHEMRERVANFIGSTHQLPFIGTFHAYCLQLLKKNSHVTGVPQFSILDADDQSKLVHSLITRNQLQKRITTKNALQQISKIKNNPLPDGSALAPLDPIIRSLYAAYEQEKKLSHCYDFDDLLHVSLQLLKKNTEFRKQFQKNIRHVLVDEYQDTNTTQHELLKLMTLDNKEFCIDSLCVVGDEDQSIYSWRGATIANIIHFKKDFPRTQTITIDQNYRSAQPILDMANKLIVHNKNRSVKNLWSDKKGIDRVRAVTCLSGYQEAEVVCSLLKTIQGTKHLESIAILYRAHYQSRALEEALVKNAIPYKIFGGVQFYERAEVKDMLAYLRLVINPFDRISLLRVINTPTRGLGTKFEEDLLELWNKEPFAPFTQACTQLLAEQPTAKKESLKAFLDVFTSLTPQTTPTQALEHIVTQSGYIAYLKKEHEPEVAQAKIENIRELAQAVAHAQVQGKRTIDAFLDDVMLMQDTTHEQEHGIRVPLMTMHAAKGLEFDTVIITGLEEGVIPSSRALYESEHIEEERRLLYVGITRARERLLLLNARYRHIYGQMESQVPSRFVKELTSLSCTDGTAWTNTQSRRFFSQWFAVQYADTYTVTTFSRHTV